MPRKDDLPALPHRPLFPRLFVLTAWLLLIAVNVLMILDLVMSQHHSLFFELLRSPMEMLEYVARYTAPDFREFPNYLYLMGITLAIALWGTFLAVILALLLAPLAAGNLSPHPAIYWSARTLATFLRSVPDPVLALLLVGGMGVGPLPGVVALGLHTGGFLAKFFAESLERVDGKVYQALQATGARWLQRLMFGGWPSIMRELIGYSLYIVDRNVRMACALGLVNVGGIGLALRTSLGRFEYARSSAILLLILATILMVDYVSTWLRGKLQ